ncbi:hypothetical protein E2C01_078794 [Portunus trituberculatus]|uniref:Uncharacterized protein n=1 Tax=Portunus trituberculatus TaxID=210409 RepID=A0A5B7ITR7_PORTR|nr:hypothetical protein [Portunus trituberculatus]
MEILTRRLRRQGEGVLEGRMQVVPGEGCKVGVHYHQDMTLHLSHSKGITVVLQQDGQHA